MTLHIRIATRKSPLALWQAEHVSAALRESDNGITTELVPMTTQGDKILDSPLAKIGGKGLFVKELEQGMLAGSADIAVHSMKDVPVELPDGLGLHCIMQREDPLDAFVSNAFASFSDLPQGARVGTSSLRRQCQLLAIRPDLQIISLRGNVNSRLQKLDDGLYDAIILASAGLKRLGFGERITQQLPVDTCLPAIGQGAIGIECRDDHTELREALLKIQDEDTRLRVAAERALNARLEGGCQVPIAGHATILDGQLRLDALVGEVDGGHVLRAHAEGQPQDAAQIGDDCGKQLLAVGAGEILQRLS